MKVGSIAECLEYSAIQEVFHVFLTNLKMPLLIYFSLYWVIIDFHGLF